MPITKNHMALREEVVRLFTNFSIEIYPREARAIKDFRTLIPLGTKVFIPYLSDQSPAQIIETAVKLKDQEMIPVAHLPARRILDDDHLNRYVQALHENAAINDLLIIGGDPNPALGTYDNSAEIITSEPLNKAGINNIGLVFHPEDHPCVNQEKLRASLTLKIALCKRYGFEPYLISQLVLSHTPMIHWADHLADDVTKTLPIYVNLPGLAPPREVARFAKQFGVEANLEALIREASTSDQTPPSPLVAQTIQQLAEYNLAQGKPIFYSLHVSPFGTFRSSAKWANAIATGQREVIELLLSPS